MTERVGPSIGFCRQQLECARCRHPLPPLTQAPFLYRCGAADTLERLDPLLVEHRLYIPSNDPSDVTCQCHSRHSGFRYRQIGRSESASEASIGSENSVLHNDQRKAEENRKNSTWLGLRDDVRNWLVTAA